MTTQAGPVAADRLAQARAGVSTAILNTGAFLLAFVLACAVIRMPIPLEQIPGSGFKYGYFSKHKDDFDLIFLGSSRVFHHFLPQQFDEQIRTETGIPLKSFNFGYDAMWPPESFYMLRQVLALHPKRLRWVLIDLMQIDPKIDTENQTTLRIAYWHDWRHTLMAWRALKDERLPLGEKWGLAIAHGQELVNRWTNRGRCAEWLGKKLRPPENKRPKPRLWEETGGFEVGGDHIMAGAELKDFDASVERLRKSLRSSPLKPAFRDAVSEIVAEVRAVGAEPIFVLAPTLSHRENVTPLPGDVRTLSFANPNEFPALYDAVNHYDGWHLNEKGAQIFTRHLAERFSSVLKEHSTGNSAVSSSQ